MVLAKHGKAQYTFPVSTGAPATPTIRGHYHFYCADPGYNSEGMYYSVYCTAGTRSTATTRSRPTRQPRLRPQPDPRVELHLQLDLASGLDLGYG